MIIKFENKLSVQSKIPVGMHLSGGGYDIQSDGSWCGENPNTAVLPDGIIYYRWRTGAMGSVHFHNAGDMQVRRPPLSIHM